MVEQHREESRGKKMNVLQGKPLPLGATIENELVNFAIQVEADKKCELLFFQKGDNKVAERFELEEHPIYSNVRFTAFHKNDVIEMEYIYEINGLRVLDPYVREVVQNDIAEEVLEQDKGNSMSLSSHMNTEELKEGIHGRIVELEWEFENEYESIEDHEVIAYRIHVKGFTKHVSSKVKGKGLFSGLLEKITYLKELGVNQLQLLPCHEFEEEKYKNYWGYAKGAYFAPKSTYCNSDDSVKELRELVAEFHKHKIGVILDIPFLGGESFSYQLECLQYYIIQYHIDGFVLNPYVTNVEELRRDGIVSSAKLLVQNDDFLHTMRRFLKGDEGMVKDVMRCVCKKGDYNYITNHNGFTLADVVSYDGKHNELNGERNQDGTDYNDSWNCGVEGLTRRKAVVALRKQQIRNAFALLLLAQGTPCILGGDEFANSQKGNNNAYCQDNEISWLNWRQLSKESELFEYVKALIEIRKMYPVLHQKDCLKGMDYLSCGMPDVSFHGENAWQEPIEMASRQLGVYYAGKYAGHESCYIAYNMHWIDHKCALPALEKKKQWYEILDTTVGVHTELVLVENQRSVEVTQRSIRMFVSK